MDIGIENFGPYRGSQSLSFGMDRPIVLVHGENMRGKTTLLNSIRWALYGRALDRFGRVVPLVKLINFDEAKIGNWTMQVTLEFEVDNMKYELVRAAQRKDKSITPRNDNDFEVRLYLRKGGTHLNPDEAQTEVNRILPEQISRFFLFDGELLNEYEILLSNVDKQAQTVRDSIEHILGVPALLNSLADLNNNLREAAKRQTNVASKDQAAQVFATQAGMLEADAETAEEDVRQLNQLRDEALEEQRSLDERLQATAAIEADVATLGHLMAAIETSRNELERLAQTKRDLLVDAWRDVIQPKLTEEIERLGQEQQALLGIIERAGELRARLRELEALATGKCPVCGQRFQSTEEVADWIEETQKDLNELHYDEEALNRVSTGIRRLNRIRPAGAADALKVTEEQAIRLRVSMVDAEFKRDEINNRLKGHDHAEISRNRRDYDDTTKSIGVLEAKIAERQEEVDHKRREASRVRANISKVGGPELARLNREVEINEGLIALFRHAVDQLRDELRKSVESDASAIFLDLTTDKTYTGLRISENYGLTILNADNEEVQVRSAGAEQVVALSLIGALNRNAVRRGPIVMDTPFGRLDPKHRENILRFIPTMADQVTLLVHGGEVDRERDLAHIRHMIDCEYEIEYVSSSQSRIARIGA